MRVRNDTNYWASKPIVAVRPEVAPVAVEPTALKRPRQRDCQHEPPYPEHFTVVISLSDPNQVVHSVSGGLSMRCYKPYPHQISECDEFKITDRDIYEDSRLFE